MQKNVCLVSIIREVSSYPASAHHACAKRRRRSVYKSSGTIQVWVDTGAYRCVVLRGLLSCCSASFLQLVFSGVEAFAVKLAPQHNTPIRPCVYPNLYDAWTFVDTPSSSFCTRMMNGSRIWRHFPDDRYVSPVSWNVRWIVHIKVITRVAHYNQIYFEK